MNPQNHEPLSEAELERVIRLETGKLGDRVWYYARNDKDTSNASTAERQAADAILALIAQARQSSAPDAPSFLGHLLRHKGRDDAVFIPAGSGHIPLASGGTVTPIYDGPQNVCVPSPRADGWRPIETAPKDGTRILAFTPWGLIEVNWNDSDYEWASYEHGLGFGSSPPTHWMPLPSPPTSDKGTL